MFYCYIGYGLLAMIIIYCRRILLPRQKKSSSSEVIPVTIIVTVYNEEKLLIQKIENTLSIKYPEDKLHLIFITDGSSDSSEKIVKQYSSILSMHQQGRKGKYAAIKRAMQQVRTPVVVFSDANTMLNRDCIKRITAHYIYENTGGVAGEKKIISNKNVSAVGQAEGLYWKYESFMKKLDASLNTVTGAAGELFSIRTALFKEMDDDLILDDFVTSMQICLQGYKIVYEPKAFATEMPSASLFEEEKRKVRISAGAYQSIGYLKECLNVFKHPLLSFQYISRRLLRWTFCPVMLFVLLITNLIIAVDQYSTVLFTLIFYGQLTFYLFAFAGWILVRSGKGAGLFTIPFYFVFMNYCLVKGLVKFVKGKETVLWEKSLRQPME